MDGWLGANRFLFRNKLRNVYSLRKNGGNNEINGRTASRTY